jgi:prepilin-type N-terminal cleavage/methylation domain-containing protein
MKMIERYRKIQRQRAAGEVDVAGFTLIELLIVIVVLGILAAVVVFALGGVSSQSAVAACNADAKTVQTAVAAYDAQTGNEPDAVAVAAGVASGPGIGELVTGSPSYLQSWPNNTGTNYTITLDDPAAVPAAVPGEVDVTIKGNTTAYSASACAGATTS